MNPETGSFADRHLGPRPAERDQMLATIGVPTLDALMDEAIPASIRLDKPLALPEGESEHQFLARLRDVARRNRVFRSYIGLGYYDTITPGVILRTIFENPSWYTPYTPYQAEISQGRLEALLTFQTVVRDLTAMEIANASLLDEPTAAAEAMTMMHRVQARQGGDERNVLLVSDQCYPQTIDVVRGRAEPAGHLRRRRPDRLPGRRRQGVRRARAESRRQRRHCRPDGAHRACSCRGGPGRRGDRSAEPDVDETARGDGRRRGARQRAAIRRADGLRRAARRVLCDARGVRQTGAGPDHRSVRRRAGQSRVPHGAPDSRTAHPPREGHIQHLHGPGAARHHGRDVRRLPRPGWTPWYRPPRPRAGDLPRRGVDGHRLPSGECRVLRYGAVRGARRTAGAGSAGGAESRHELQVPARGVGAHHRARRDIHRRRRPGHRRGRRVGIGTPHRRREATGCTRRDAVLAGRTRATDDRTSRTRYSIRIGRKPR